MTGSPGLLDRGETAPDLERLPLELRRERVVAEARRIEDTLAELEGAGSGDPAAHLHATFALGEEIRSAHQVSQAIAGRALHDPLAFIEEETSWVSRSARDLARWGKSLAPAAHAVEGRAGALRSKLTQLRLRRFLDRSVDPATTAAAGSFAEAWREVLESNRLEEEIEKRRLELGGEPPLESLAALRARRALSLGRAGTCLEALPIEERTRLFHQRAAELLDQSSAALSEGATSSPAERVISMRSLQANLEGLLEIAGGRRGPRILHGDLSPLEREARRDLKRLCDARRRAQHADRAAAARVRLEKRFGARRVRLWETWLLVLILAFLALVFIEWRLPPDSPYLPVLYGADLVLCVFFQIDFFVRWALTRWNRRYFLSRFFFESLPALPFGLFFHLLGTPSGWAPVEEARAIIAVRLLSVRNIMLLAVRILRVLVFFVIGTDRVVERFRRVLDRDVVLFDPAPAEAKSPTLDTERLLHLEARRQKLATSLHSELRWDERPAALTSYLERLEVEAERQASLPFRYEPSPAGAGEVRLERVVHTLLECDSAQALAALGPEGVQRAARWLRFFDVWPLRYGPIVRRIAPAARLPRPADATAAAARALGNSLDRFHCTLKFLGDVSGITTGPQVLDRLGTAIITASSRPAIRLLMFGSLFLFLQGLVELFRIRVLSAPIEFLERILGLPLLILGSLCLIVLLTGRWLKRVAGEALDVYLRGADAQFYPLLKSWKEQRAARDLPALCRSVILPELKLRGQTDISEKAWADHMAECLRSAPCFNQPPAGGQFAPFEKDCQRLALLYRDFLDGPLLHRGDDKTSVQLLGNVVVQEVRGQISGFSRRERRRLERLDLAKDRFLGIGPYFWFRFMTESLAIETAKLVLEYNTSCLPLAELPRAAPGALRRLESFLESRRGPWEAAVERRAGKGMRCRGEPTLTDEFTVLDFLTVRPERDEEIGRVFGPEVQSALRRDREGLVRDVFGTRPYHLLPRAQRVFNPYRLYQRYLSGAKFLLLPLMIALAGTRIVGSALHQVFELVREVLGKERESISLPSRRAPFEVAVRKINRMRKPFFMEALRLRAAIDIDYLGLDPGNPARDERRPGYREDLTFIGASDSESRLFEEARRTAQRDLRRLRSFLSRQGLEDDGFLVLLRRLDQTGDLATRPGEARRALATAYLTDHHEIRSRITAPQEVRELVENAMEVREPFSIRLRSALAAPLLALLPSSRRHRRTVREYLAASDELRTLPHRQRAKAGRALLSDARMKRKVELAVEAQRRGGGGGRGGNGPDPVLQLVERVLLDSGSWTRKVMTVRAIQAITVLDVQCYRELIWSAGGYAEDAR